MKNKKNEVAELIIMAMPTNQAFVVKGDKINDFLAIKPDKKAAEAARKRVATFNKVCKVVKD